MRNRLSKVKLGAYAFSLLFALSFVGGVFSSPSASAATRTKCSATSPSYKQWQTTIQYGLANAFCIKDGRGGELVWQDDGNLVWYINGVAKWASGTYNRGKFFKLQSDANMVIYDASNKAVWASSWVQKEGWGAWWSPGMTATGNCKYYVSAWYNTSDHNHYIDQGIGCGQSGAEFWYKKSFDPISL